MSESINTQQIYLDHICSMEYYQRGEEEPQQVLKDICLDMAKGQIWAVLGNSAFELRLLMEIIANARPYKSGTCILAQRGMMRKKRGILPHVYYIGSTNMLFDNMKVLEYMMYITAKAEGDVIERQKAVFQFLLDHELGYLSLSNIKDITPSERAIITLVAALYTNSEIIVYNIARLQYDEMGLKALRSLCEEIKKQGRTLIFSTFDYRMAQTITTHVAALVDGEIRYQGTLVDFLETWDHLSVVIEDERIDNIVEIIKTAFPELDIHQEKQRIELWDASHDLHLYEHVMRILCAYHMYPQAIAQHHHCVENAWKEVCIHDL